MERTIKITTHVEASSYPIAIGSGILDRCGGWARALLGNRPSKAVIVSNRRISGLYGETVRTSLANAGFDVTLWNIGDGERFKNLRSLHELLGVFGSVGLSRTDIVVALGGGVVGDLAGFAAASYLRGIGILQIPTTLLSMIDSSVGGKTGINTEHGKNLVGAFHQPSGVLIDVSVLKTLARREVVAGFCEAVKHAALGGGGLFALTRNFLSQYPTGRFSRHFNDTQFSTALANLIFEQVSFKAGLVAGDEFENVGRTDGRSRKILNFGHTLAHALEKETDYRYFKHGEAVGIGIVFAARLSKSLELFGQDELNLLNDVVMSVGRLPDTHQIDANSVISRFLADKKNVAGDLHWVLLRGIGKPVIVAGSEISEESIRECVVEVLKCPV